MLKAFNKPYHHFWLSIPLILGLSIIGIGRIIDLQLHDTYFVISLLHVGIFFSIISAILGLLYWLMRDIKLINWLILFHLVITISAFFIFMVVALIYRTGPEPVYRFFSNANQILLATMWIAIICQLVFLANLVLSLIEKKDQK